jgi:hypothetical protein
MHALLQALSHSPRRVVVRALVVVALAAIVSSGLILYDRWATAQRDRCASSDAPLTGVWDASRKEAVAAAFRASGAPFAEGASRGVAKGLDAVTAAWAARSLQFCEETRIRQEQSERVLEARTQCLLRLRDELAAFVTLLSAADARVVEHAPLAVLRLGTPDACAASRAPSAAVPPAFAAGDDLGHLLAQARALLYLGKTGEALAWGMEAASLAERAGDKASLAMALALQGEAQLEVQPEQATLPLAQGFFAAEASGDDEIAISTATTLAEVLARRPEGREEAGRWVRRAEAALQAMGGDPRLEARLCESRAEILRRGGRLDEAAAQYARSREILERAFGSSDVRVGLVLRKEAAVARERRDAAAASRDLRRASAILRSTLGAEHPVARATAREADAGDVRAR